MESIDEVTNPFIRAHLAYTEDTEPPKLMHIWSALAAASASMGRHVWFPFDIGDVYPNIYTLLVGPPATRKSTAIKLASDFVRAHTDVRFAPDDTAGQRQGLITALGAISDEEEDEENRALDAGDVVAMGDILANKEVEINNVDKHVMFICAKEWGSFMGQNNLDLTRFLIRLYDGDDYKYGLRRDMATLTNPLATMIGGTTPTDISTLLPAEAIGQGFMSRIIMVFGATKHKDVPRPKLDQGLKKALGEVYSWLWYEMRGAMRESATAAGMFDTLYSHRVKIHDNRFMYYAERRQIHLLKVSMLLAAVRGSYEIEPQDVYEAHGLLHLTEQYMPDALGEYGLSPLARAKQKMVEFIRGAGQPVTDVVLWTVMQRDMKQIDYRTSLAGLVNAGKIAQVTTTLGSAFVYKDDLREAVEFTPVDDDVLSILTGNDPPPLPLDNVANTEK